MGQTVNSFRNMEACWHQYDHLAWCLRVCVYSACLVWDLEQRPHWVECWFFILHWKQRCYSVFVAGWFPIKCATAELLCKQLDSLPCVSFTECGSV